MNQEHHLNSRKANNIKNIKLALFINFVFTIIELIGGFLANSVAIISNAIHDLGDTIALSFSYFSERFASHKTSDDNYTYGLNRLPLLSAFINSVILLVGSIFILYNTIPRLFAHESPKANLMIIVAIAGVFANGLALYKLKANEGLNSRVMGLHLLEDVLGWLSVLIGGIVIKYFGFHIIDPLLSIAITLYILFNVFKNLRTAFQLFMQKSPATIDSNEILFKIKEDKNIISIEDFHIWSLEGTQHVLSAHIKVKDTIEPADLMALKSRIRKEIKMYGDIHSTIEFEYESENCDDHC